LGGETVRMDVAKAAHGPTTASPIAAAASSSASGSADVKR
jgi:hypothetical protein